MLRELNAEPPTMLYAYRTAEATTSSNQEEQKAKSSSKLKDVVKKLTELGPPGIASYGILNSMYYTVRTSIFHVSGPRVTHKHL